MDLKIQSGPGSSLGPSSESGGLDKRGQKLLRVRAWGSGDPTHGCPCPPQPMSSGHTHFTAHSTDTVKAPSSTAHTCLQAIHLFPQCTSVYTAPKPYPLPWATNSLYCQPFRQPDPVYTAGPRPHLLNPLAWAPLVMRRGKRRGVSVKLPFPTALASLGQRKPRGLNPLQIQLLGTALVGGSCPLFSADRLIRGWGVSWAKSSATQAAAAWAGEGWGSCWEETSVPCLAF